MRPDAIPPRAALKLRRFDPAKDADRVRLADSVLFHLVERVAGENDLAAREITRKSFLASAGRSGSVSGDIDYGPSVDIKSTIRCPGPSPQGRLGLLFGSQLVRLLVDGGRRLRDNRAPEVQP